MSAPAILRDSALSTTTNIAAALMQQIQGLVNAQWVIDYDIPGGGGSLSGNPNHVVYNYTENFSESGTIIPGIPAFTITPAFYVPAVVMPAVPGWGTVNWCPPWSCTSEVPGTPAFTVTPGYTVPAVISPAVPALTGGFSTRLDVDATVSGVSSALTPLFSSVTFTGASMSAPDSSTGLANQTVTYNLGEIIDGDAIRISGSAAFRDLRVTVAGVTTNFGSISTGNINLDVVPDLPIYFDAIINIPSFSSTPDRFANGVAYELFPLASQVSVDNLELSTGITALADFVVEGLLDPLTAIWNSTVVPLFTVVGAPAPVAPSQTAARKVSNGAAGVQADANAAAESGLNSLLDSQLGTIQPFVQDLTAVTWNYGDYPIFPGGNFSGALLAGGLFAGTDASNSSFNSANLSNADFSNSNLSGSTFVNANLTGVNFSGATGAPSASLASASMTRAAKVERSTPGPFSNAVIFGTNFNGSSLDPSGAFYDNTTRFADGYDPSANGLQYFSAAQLVAGNKSLIKAFGSETQEAAAAFIADAPVFGSHGKRGLRTDVVTGKLMLDGFNEKSYFRSLSSTQQNKLNDLLSSDPELDRADALAMHKIANAQVWDTSTSEMYLFSNSDLIADYRSPKQALKSAREQYLTEGFFQGRPLNNEDNYAIYIDTYPAALYGSGAVFDEASLAHHFVTQGYSEGQRLPSPFA
jgi:hypothetical protein